MSGSIDTLALKEEDVTKFLACASHLGANNVDFQMEQYVYKRRPDGTSIINVRKTWEKVLLAARAIAAIENPADICVISARPYGQRAVLKFAHYTGATPIAGRFTPGTFTNQIQTAFREPRLLVVTDPYTDHQPVTEASYVNIPVIALTNTDSPLKYVDIAIPCNNKSIHSVGLMWWMLAREVLRLSKRIRRHASVKELMIVGRIFIVVMTGVAVAWVPVVKETQGGQVFIYIQEVTNYLAPPVACVYLIAVLWPRCNEQGAFWGLMAGFVTGVVRLVLIFVFPAPDRCGQEDDRPAILTNLHYMYFAMILFWVTFVVTVAGSLVTQPPGYDKIYRTTFWSRHDNEDTEAVETGKIKAVWRCCQYSVKTAANTATFDNLAITTDGDSGGMQEAGDQTGAKTGNETRNDTSQHSFSGATTEGVGNFTYDKQSVKSFLISWLCGISEEADQNEAQEDEDRREEEICSLKQDPFAKILLHILLVLILLLGTGLYIFWSVWKYEVPLNDVSHAVNKTL